MNRTNIEWTQFTWNPITGCTRGCEYCYARRLAEGRLRGRYGYPEDDPFQPTFHPDRLREPYERQKASLIFTCSMGEYFDPHVHPDWEAQVWKVMRENPQHIFQILTKQPSRAVASRFSENVWLGMSVDGKTANLTGQMIFSKHPHQQKFVSFEPLLGPVLPYLENIKWVIIGSKTGPRPEQPKKEWVQAIIDQARKQNTPVFLKDNLEWPEKIQEWPAEMRAIVEGQ